MSPLLHLTNKGHSPSFHPNQNPHPFKPRFSNSSPSSSFLVVSIMLGNWPSRDPHNFTQLRPSDPRNPSRLQATTYHPTHNRTLPPPDQVICTESKNILIRHFYKFTKEELRPKRAASELIAPEAGSKHQRPSSSTSQL